MGSRQSAEEIKKEHLQVLGPTLGPLFHELYNEVVWLHAKWLEYRKLYAHSAKRIDLLNNTAPFFFRTIQSVLWENLILHIACLVDTPKSRGKKNLTLRMLPSAIPEQKLKKEVQQLVNKAVSKSSFTRNWRNRLYAHKDLDLALKRSVHALPKANLQEVETALETFRAVLNKIMDHYFKSKVMFEGFQVLDDAKALLHYLCVAKDVESKREERLRKGQPLPEDLEPPPDI